MIIYAELLMLYNLTFYSWIGSNNLWLHKYVFLETPLILIYNFTSPRILKKKQKKNNKQTKTNQFWKAVNGIFLNVTRR